MQLYIRISTGLLYPISFGADFLRRLIMRLHVPKNPQFPIHQLRMGDSSEHHTEFQGNHISANNSHVSTISELHGDIAYLLAINCFWHNRTLRIKVWYLSICWVRNIVLIVYVLFYMASFLLNEIICSCRILLKKRIRIGADLIRRLIDSSWFSFISRTTFPFKNSIHKELKNFYRNIWNESVIVQAISYNYLIFRNSKEKIGRASCRERVYVLV